MEVAEFERQKITLHQASKEFEPKAGKPMPGSGDFCLITEVPLELVTENIRSCSVEIIKGPASRTRATGRLTSTISATRTATSLRCPTTRIVFEDSEPCGRA